MDVHVVGQARQHLVEVPPGAGGVHAARQLGELVERQAPLARVPAECVDHPLAVVITDAHIAGLHNGRQFAPPGKPGPPPSATRRPTDQ